MAALTNPTILGSGGGSGLPRWAVLAFPKVTAGDTYDVGTLSGVAAFQTVWTALGSATSSRNVTTALASIAGTVVTINGTGMSADAVLLWVTGE